MLTEQEEIQLQQLKAKKKRLPDNPKKVVWDAEIIRLEEKRNEARKQVLKTSNNTSKRTNQSKQPTTQRMYVKDNMSNSNVEVQEVRQAAGELEQAMSNAVASMLNADVGAVRLPDDYSVQTALYHSVYQAGLYVDPSVNAGAFTVLVQPKLGGLGKTKHYNIAISGQGTNNFNTPGAFLSDVEGQDPRIDENLDLFLNCPNVQNTWAAVYNFPTNPPIVNLYPQNITNSGYKNSGFIHYDQGVFSPILGFTPAHGAFFVPDGNYYHNILITGYSQFQSFDNAQSIVMTSGTQIDIVLSLFEFANGVETQLDRIRVQYNPQTQQVTGYTPPSGTFLKFAKGAINGVLGQNTNGVINLSFFSSFSTPSDALRYFAIEIDNFAAVNNGNPPQLQQLWDISSSTIDASDEVNCSDIRIQKIRPTAQKIHFYCTLSEFNNSGEVALNLMQGGAQQYMFGPDGGNKTTFSALSNYNLPLRQYTGKLSTGAYGFWVPDTLDDCLPITYAESLEYEYPFFALAGRWTPTGASPGLQQIGILRVVTNYEYTTTTTAFDTDVQIGNQAIMNNIRTCFSQVPKTMENPEHKDILKAIAKRATQTAKVMISVGNTAAKIGSGALSLMSSIGLG